MQPGKSLPPYYWPVFLVSLAFTFLMFSLPIYSKELGASALEIGGLYTIFTITLIVGRPLVGWALDRFGRKPFFVAALAGYAATMGLFALAHSLPGLYLARFAQGVASSLMWITVNTLVADTSAPNERGRNVGRVNEANSRGGMVGVFLGFAIFFELSQAKSQAVGWTVTMLVYAASALAAAVLAWKILPETRPVVDPTEPPPRTISRPLSYLMIAVFFTNIAMAMIGPLFLIYLQDRFTTNIETLAWAFFPAGLVMSFLPSRLGRLSDRYGRAPLMAAGLMTEAILSAFLPNLPSLVWLAALYTLTAVGWSMAGPAEAAMVADLTGQQTRGRGYGLYEFADSLGASIGPLLGGWLYDSTGKSAPFYVNAAILLAGAIWVLGFLSKTTLNKHF